VSKVVSPKEVAASLTEFWSPRVIGEVDDSFLKVAKVKGSLAWHSHENEDEVFLILDGVSKIELEQDTVVLGPGEMYDVPKGVQHNLRKAMEQGFNATWCSTPGPYAYGDRV